MDKSGQEDRIYMREKICPISGPGLLTASARERKAKEIIAASGADKEQTLNEAEASVLGTTFRRQSETWLSIMGKRKAAASTLYNWKNCLDMWLLPTDVNGTLFGDLPLASIKKTPSSTGSVWPLGVGLRLLCILITRCYGDQNEGTFSIFHRWSCNRRPLRTHPGKESGTPDRRFTWSLGDGAWRTVRDLGSDEKARRFTCRIRLPRR
jgi:hypothetical protein